MKTTDTGWTELLLICRTCARKRDGGFGPDGRDGLRRALRDGLRARGRRGSVGVVETGCMGVCPKRAVTTGLGSRPGQLLALRHQADADALLGRLLNDPHRPSGEPDA